MIKIKIKNPQLVGAGEFSTFGVLFDDVNICVVIKELDFDKFLFFFKKKKKLKNNF